MIIQLENARICYDEIVKRVKKYNGKVIIFVGYDIDALCTLRMLVFLLRGDWLKYEIVPVMNFDQLDQKIEEYKTIGYVKSFILINCGGTRDMTKHWFSEQNDFLCLLLDIRRPSHHNNVHSKNILLVNDNHYQIDDCPKEEDIQDVQSEEEDIEDIEDEELYKDNDMEKKEDLSEEEEDGEKPKKRRLQKKKALEEDDDEDFSAKKTIQPEIDEKKLRRRIKMKKRMKIENYYSGNYYGYPSSYILYKVATQMHREDTYLLWLLIIALTDQYLKLHIDHMQYELIYEECFREVSRLNQNNKQDNIVRRFKTEDPDNIEYNKYDYSDVTVKSSNKENKSIIVDTDYNLYLFRHWNVFDSFVYSNYTLSHLITWKEQGKKEVQKLFAYMGIPLEEAKQKYAYMKNEYKSLFKEKIVEISKKFDLKELLFNSFIYQLDQRNQYSASDFVHCINAILQYPFSINELKQNGVDFDSFNEQENKDENIDDEEKQKIIDENNKAIRANKYDHFWASYDLLSLKSTEFFRISLDLAIQFQKALVSNGTSIIDKKSITPSKHFRYSIINTDTSEEIKYFQHPLSLEKLALFVMDTYHNSRFCKNKVDKPFILAVLNSSNKTYLVAGVLGKAKEEGHDKNPFAVRFRLSANNIGAKLLLNNFDDSIIEIPKDNFLAFLEEVCED
jgi:cell division control protein 45